MPRSQPKPLSQERPFGQPNWGLDYQIRFAGYAQFCGTPPVVSNVTLDGLELAPEPVRGVLAYVAIVGSAQRPIPGGSGCQVQQRSRCGSCGLSIRGEPPRKTG
ncbi:hypothetical protein SBA3_1250035 [Candidatus Sulfopaludibacter sp. SbA3]|nr:hypothetical protein SBA3_1250035 [Candidatus Sulfopaludibacter sp. SbA3]